jgi:transposase-like protein
MADTPNSYTGNMKPRTTIASLSRDIRSEADAYRLMETLRWGDSPTCTHCGSEVVYLIPPANGISRKTAAGTMSERRVWKCRECKRQFSVLTGTIMHATKISVRIWVMVLFDMAASKNGMSAREVERRYGVCPRSAWHMLHRIRLAMAGGDRLVSTMRGVVVSDETWIGGDPKNRHAWQRNLANHTPK